MSKSEQYEQAEQRWIDMDLAEKLSEVDSEGGREMLVEFETWLKKRIKMAEGIRLDSGDRFRGTTEINIEMTLRTLSRFVDEQFMEDWCWREVGEAEAAEVDRAYDSNRDQEAGAL